MQKMEHFILSVFSFVVQVGMVAGWLICMPFILFGNLVRLLTMLAQPTRLSGSPTDKNRDESAAGKASRWKDLKNV